MVMQSWYICFSSHI